MRKENGFSLIRLVPGRMAVCAAVVLMTLIAAHAKTSDGEQPSVENACDGQVGNAFGLCNAYCEAMDCDSANSLASSQACERVHRNFQRAAGDGVEMPCMLPPTVPDTAAECPCNFDVEFWTDPNLEAQILQTVNAAPCDPGGSPTGTCFTCDVEFFSVGSSTFLSVLVDLWVSGEVSKEDALFFFTTDPSSGGACFAEGSVDSDPFYSTLDSTGEVSELPVTVEQFFRGACHDGIARCVSRSLLAVTVHKP